MITGGRRTISKCVLLVFHEPEARPRLAIKCPRVPWAAKSLAREAEALQLIEARCPGGVPGVPRILFRCDRSGSLSIGQTALSGYTFRFGQIQRGNARRLALRVTDWLIGFARRTMSGWRFGWQEEIADPALIAFAELFSGAVDRGLVERAREALCGAGALPALPEQRDFSPWNILTMADGGLACTGLGIGRA